MSKMVQIPSHDGGNFAAYFAAPPRTPAPGLVLIQYICGVNRVMRGLADEFAAAGYNVVVPDLFWRQEPDVRLIDDPSRPTDAEQRKALALNAGFNDDLAVADLRATLSWLRKAAGCSGGVGTLGYCLGGRMAYLMATRSDADCNLGYYGVNIDAHLGEAENIRKPLMLHIAGEDELCRAEARAKIATALGMRPAAVTHTYPGVGHAFALTGGHNFVAAAAALANSRSAEFLAKHLSVAPEA